MQTEQIYLWVGLLVLGLADLYLYKYPMFHPIVMLTAAGWAWGDVTTGLIVGGIFELVFGLAQLTDARRLNLTLYAGGLALFLNQVTQNINIILSMTIGLILAFALQAGLEKVKEWHRWLILTGLSGILVFILPLGKEMFGWIPSQLLSQMSISGGILPWIFFAYAIAGIVGKNKDHAIEMAIPAVITGSVLNLQSFIWGPIVFVFLYYIMDALIKDRNWAYLPWLNWVLLIAGAYFLLPNLLIMTFWVFLGMLVFNYLCVTRGFAPLEIYLLNFIIGIILSRGGLLT